MSVLTSRSFWFDTIERALKTFAQTAAALLAAFVSGGHGLEAVNWVMVASVSGLAAIFSVVTSIGSAKVGDKDSASLVL